MRVRRSLMTAVHHGTPLVVRASLPRTFLGIGIFAEVGPLFAGVYLLSEALRRPLEAQAAVIGAGVLLSLATVLLFYLVRPKRFAALAKKDGPNGEERQLESPLTLYGELVQARQRATKALEETDRLPGPM